MQGLAWNARGPIFAWRWVQDWKNSIVNVEMTFADAASGLQHLGAMQSATLMAQNFGATRGSNVGRASLGVHGRGRNIGDATLVRSTPFGVQR